MSAAIARTPWAPRPVPRTLEQLAALARRTGRRLHARVRLPTGWSDVFFDGATVLHAKAGWALGRRALAQLSAAERFGEVHLQWDESPELLTVARPWVQVRAELAWAARAAERSDAAAPRARARGIGQRSTCAT